MAGWIGTPAALPLFVAAWMVLPSGPSRADDATVGYLAITRGEHTAAIELLTRAIEGGGLPIPARVSAHINRGIAFRQQGNFQAAIDDYAHALELDRNNALAFANRGLALAKWERYDEAIADFDRAIALTPSDARLFFMRGNARFDKGAFEDSIRDYDEALRIRPRFREAALNRNDALERLKHPDRPCHCNDATKPNGAIKRTRYVP